MDDSFEGCSSEGGIPLVTDRQSTNVDSVQSQRKCLGNFSWLFFGPMDHVGGLDISYQGKIERCVRAADLTILPWLLQ